MNKVLRCMLRRGISLIVIIALLKIAVPGTSVRAQESTGFIPHEVLLKLSRTSDLGRVAAAYALHATPLAQFGTRAIFRMRILDGASPQEKAAELTEDSRVVYAEPNLIGQAPEAQQRVSWSKGDEGQGSDHHWATIMIRLPEAHTVTRGAGVTVAVLDTGVDLDHPALMGRLVSGYDFVDLDAMPKEEGNHDQNVAFGHGTHVAGLVALVAPEAKIMPLRVLDPDGYSNIWVLAEAMAYAVNPDGNLETDDGADVINLSLSTSRPTHLLADIGQAVTCIRDQEDDDDDNERSSGCLAQNGEQGVVIVASAGNNGSSAPEYPAAEGADGSLAVGASAPSDTLASFSNYGPWVHVMAPGQSIFSSIPGGEFAFWSGTSMAAPLVAGEAALVRAANPRMDAEAVVKRIVDTSFVLDGPVPRRIDAAAALGIPLLPIRSEYRCAGTLGPLTVDNIMVTSGQTCTLVGTRVRGNVKIEAGAVLHAIGIHITGNIQAKGATMATLRDAIVEGSIQVEESGSAQLQFSQISGGVQLFKNSGDLWISDNIIGGNLQCKENRHIPTGGGNIVTGSREQQCSNL